MKNSPALSGVLVTTLFVLAFPISALPENPMFRGTPQRNPVNLVERNLPTDWNVAAGKQNNIKWVANLGTRAYGGPVIADGRIFVGTNNQRPRNPNDFRPNKDSGRIEPLDLGVIKCFREADGTFLWQAVHEKLPGGIVNDWPRQGIASTPAVEGKRFYYVSNRCELICADVANGKPIWTLDMIKDLGVFPHCLANCSPLIVDDTVYVITSNGVNEDHFSIPAPEAPSFLRVNKHNGNVLWKCNAPTAAIVGKHQSEQLFRHLVDRGELLMHGQWSNPACGIVDGKQQIIFPGGDGWVYAFTPTGRLLWKFDCNPKDARFNIARGDRNHFIANPVIYKNRVYLGMGDDPEYDTGVGHLWCIDMTKVGDVSPELRVNNRIVKNPNSAVVWHYGGEVAPNDRAKLKRLYYFGRTMSTCAIHDGLVYISEIWGFLHCLDADTGELQWVHNTEASIWSSPYWADNKVFLGNDNEVLVIQHGREKKLLAANDMEGRVRTTPVAHNGVLYITTENKLYAIAH